MQKDVAAAFHRLGIDDPTEQARLLAVEASGTAADADVLRIALAGRGGRVLLAVVLLLVVAVAAPYRWRGSRRSAQAPDENGRRE